MAEVDDDELLALEEELGGDGEGEEDDVFALVDHCMDAKEFAKKIAGNAEPLVAVFPDVEFSDDLCKAIGVAMGRATNLEGISIEGAVFSKTGKLRKPFMDLTRAKRRYCCSCCGSR